eukprot:TRINITY_DN39375_c0_g1_i1.p1 TRINITY_DN39375_c0_g1~~TRINITY_DN39375_c0_g1_i1.p1  ORF type:complete len:1014 (+),score=341.63 TRINITY_DN39375_c0_g1_i1:63-3044(+)
MTFAASVDIVVNFLKFRNLDLLQQGLFYVSVSARAEGGGDGEAVAVYRNSTDGRRPRWAEEGSPRYPAAAVDAAGRSVATRSFYVRFQEQVEVLSETAHLRIRFPAATACRPWRDGAVLTFDLHHCSKEVVDKLPELGYEREVGAGVWEAYPPESCAEITKMGQMATAASTVTVRTITPGETAVVEVDAQGQIAEVLPSGARRRVRGSPAVVPTASFEKVASRDIVLKNTMLTHSEWVPVVWADWYAAACPVLITTSLSGISYANVPAALSPQAKKGYVELTQSEGFDRFPEAVVQERLAKKADGGESVAECASRLFRDFASYLVYAYFSLRAMQRGLVADAGGEAGPDAAQRLQQRFRTCEPDVVHDVLRKVGCDKVAAARLVELGFADSGAPCRGGMLDQLRARHVGAEHRRRHADPTAGTGDSPRTCSALRALADAPLSVPLMTRAEALLRARAPGCAALLPSPSAEPGMLRCGRCDSPGEPHPWLTHGAAHVAPHDPETEVRATNVVCEQLVSQLATILPAEAEADPQTLAAVGPTFSAMLAAVSAEVHSAWAALVSPSGGKGTYLPSVPALAARAKRSYWRAEALRARAALSPAWHHRPPPRSGSSATQSPPSPLPSDKRVELPTTVPPFLPLTFTYPQHTLVEFQVLDHGDQQPPRPTPSAAARGGTCSDDDSPPESAPSSVMQRLERRSSGAHPAGVGMQEAGRRELLAQASSPQAVHLIVFVHGYKGNQYDFRFLRNHMALCLSVGVEFLLAKSLVDQSDLPLERLGELLAAEVAEHVRDEHLKLRALSFVAHSMGTLAVRAALVEQPMKPFLPLLHTFASFSGPHLGVADAESIRVSGALWFLSALRQSANIQQLRLDKVEGAAGLPGLSTVDNIGLFGHVLLFASDDDKYVSLQSATLDPALPGQMSKNPRKAAIVEDMLRCLHGKLGLCDSVHRFNVRFHPIGRGELSTTMERAVGKAVHVAFLSNPDFAHSFTTLFRPYFS